MRIIQSCFIDPAPPYPEAHAATIAETPQGLVAAWFAGLKESRPDVTIWLARHDGRRWYGQRSLLAGRSDGGARLPCWNPVLHQMQGGPLLLFYKVGPRPRRWWGMMTLSHDHGASWLKPWRLPAGIYGPARSKPIERADGSLLVGSSRERFGWRCQIEETPDQGITWRLLATLNERRPFKANQPSLVDHGDGRFQALCRTKNGVVTECWSADDGRSWSPMVSTGMVNPNSGLDAQCLADGRVMLVWNPVRTGRSPLTVSLSPDGRAFAHALVLEEEPGQEFSYPSMIQAADGLVHIVYTWRRRQIRHAVLEPSA